MLIWGDHDRYLRTQLAEASRRWVPQLRVEHVDASHWVQNDAPGGGQRVAVGFSLPSGIAGLAGRTGALSCRWSVSLTKNMMIPLAASEAVARKVNAMPYDPTSESTAKLPGLESLPVCEMRRDVPKNVPLPSFGATSVPMVCHEPSITLTATWFAAKPAINQMNERLA